MLTKSLRSIHLLAVFCCLLVILAACGPQTPSGTSGGQTPEIPEGSTRVPTVTARQGTTTTPVAAQTSCPPAGTGRAAVMPSLQVGRHANIVYLFNSLSPYQYQGSTFQDITSFLKSYDVTSGAKTVIASLSHSDTASATISPDGQWIMFETYTLVHPLTGQAYKTGYEYNTVLHLVRIDGQYLQTLYCGTGSPIALKFPSGYAGTTSWSPNQKLVLFNQFSLVQSRPTGMVYLLDLTSGNLQPEVEAVLSPSTWLDNTRAYLIAQGDGISPARPGLLILDTSKGPHQQETSLQTLLKTGLCQSYATNADTTQLFVGQCTFNNYMVSGPSTISVEPATGGTPQTLFTSQQLAVCDIGKISSVTLLLLVCNSNNKSQNGWWEIHTDGSGLTFLQIGSNYTQFLPIFASDGNTFSVQLDNSTGHNLVVGTLNGGTPKTYATTPDGGVDIVGWTTM
jgi:eukaryotic-like serine/threonine-protein kinase